MTTQTGEPVDAAPALAVARRWAPMPLTSWLLVLLVSVLLYGVNLQDEGTLSDYEMRDAGIARQMVDSGDWGIPWAGDVAWLEKPILPIWLMAGSIAAFGPNEAAARLPSALAGIGVVLILAGLAARWFGPNIGLLTGLVQATARYMTNHARLAGPDMILCLLVCAAIAAFVHLQAAPAGRRSLFGRQLLFWLLVGATNLAKGPLLGMVFVALTCGGWIAWRRDREALRRLWAPAAIALGLLVALAWPIAVIVQGFGRTLLDWWLHEIAVYGPGGTGTGAPFWTYGVALLWQLLPWTPLLLLGIRPSLARALRDRQSPHRLLWCWIMLPFLVLSLVPAKDENDLIHALPALSPMIALGLAKLGRFLRNPNGVRRGVVAQGLMGVAVTLTVVAAFLGARFPSIRAVSWWLGFTVAAGLFGTAVSLRLRGSGPGFFMLMATILAVSVLLRSPLIPRNDPSAADRLFLLRVSDEVPADAPVFATGAFDIARIIFYVRRPVEGIWNPDNLTGHVPVGTSFVVTRAANEPALEGLGEVALVDQSARARFERSPEDRFTLFRVDRAEGRAS